MAFTKPGWYRSLSFVQSSLNQVNMPLPEIKQTASLYQTVVLLKISPI